MNETCSFRHVDGVDMASKLTSAYRPIGRRNPLHGDHFCSVTINAGLWNSI